MVVEMGSVNLNEFLLIILNTNSMNLQLVRTGAYGVSTAQPAGQVLAREPA